jgi:hypothetical protein
MTSLHIDGGMDGQMYDWMEIQIEILIDDTIT